MTNTVTHFEIYAEEPGRLAEFYRGLLGWEIEQVPGVAYWQVRTGAEGEGIGGGLTHRPIPGPKAFVHYVHVDSIDDALAGLLRLGGSVVRAKSAVARTAWFAVVADPEGNIFALWQADPGAMPQFEPE
jgi:uncharacterized protein